MTRFTAQGSGLIAGDSGRFAIARDTAGWRRFRARTLRFGLVLGALIAARPAQAQEAQPAPAQQAASEGYDELVLRALAAYDAGRWDESRRLFEQAHGLNPTARTLRTIGMAAFNQGDFVAALQNLEAALVDTRKPLTEEQRAHVSDLIARAHEQVGRYRLQVVPEGAHVTVDGRPVTLIRGELVLMPGRHQLVARAAGHETLTRALDVRPRDRTPLELRLSPEGAQPVAAAPSSAAPAAALDASGSASTSDASRTTWGVIALSVGGVSLIASGITFALALDQKFKLDETCDGRACPIEDHDRVDDYDTLRIVSGVTLAAGLLGAAAGAWLLIGGGGDEEPVQARIAPGFVSVRGRL